MFCTFTLRLGIRFIMSSVYTPAAPAHTMMGPAGVLREAGRLL